MATGRPTRTQRKPPVRDFSSDSDDSPVRKRKKIDKDDDFELDPEKKDVQKKTKRSPLKQPKTEDSRSAGSQEGKKTRVARAPIKRKRPEKKASSAELNDEEEGKETKVSKNESEEEDKLTATSNKANVKKTSKITKAKIKNVDEADEETGEAKKPSSLKMEWNEPEYLAFLEGIQENIAAAVIWLFDEENTIPFIARYRKEMTGNMSPEKLRHVKESYDHIRNVKHKAALILKNVAKTGNLTPDLEHCIKCARDIDELEHIYAPFKPGTKRELAAKAKELGLEPAALTVLYGTEHFYPGKCVNVNVKGLETIEEVQKGIQHIIAYIISKDSDVLGLVRDLCRNVPITLESKQASTRSKPGKKSEEKAGPSKSEESKFSNYHNFSTNVRFLRSHQVLALNRGEKLKELSVRLIYPPSVENRLEYLCQQKFFGKGIMYPFRLTVLKDSVKDAYSRLIQPLMTRHIRAELNKTAERESIEVFAQNLKKLLLTPPYKGHPVLAIDPGFHHGCKAALVSSTGALLEHRVLYLHKNSFSSNPGCDGWLRDVMLQHKCDVIAIGNGAGCRETELYVSSLIKRNFFHPLNVSYTIVSEQGVSIYSCSDQAVKELPNLDPTVRSSISIARRLQDPLTELVKVEPRHLGVGMYQHDLSEKILASTLQEVVIECVSFVGVDLNTVPHCVLKQIAGIGAARADRIIEWREKNGSFFNRDQLMEVKGVGKKTFEQCAGFVRILPDTVKPENRWKLCPLDRTWIHPESYPFALKFMHENSLEKNDLGSGAFREKVQQVVTSLGGEEGVARRYNVSKDLADLVIKGLLAPINHDIRSEFEKPIFRQNVMSVSDLKVDSIVTGCVRNTTSFGAFVDIGVEINGLIHISAMGGKSISLGDRVEVSVRQLDLARRRIGLALIRTL